ncbi:cation:proton antiporter [Leptospira adleri]|uniref:Cation/H+ exchanger transmembrane domain-containing protein n=1 Tax=Leptospira adleri TaxID=2023186 RepID=A0A2M9YKV0_9LEPT|nr:cation:proton antiporter [Leptospira adleri]PJZ52144.1 hypothetical protein CH380_16815 [Leptospira adleri]PJZ62990.1 hypothetical protein CH376_05595 [Leptospira adleri]
MKLGSFRNVLVYVGFLFVFGFGICWILGHGRTLEVGIENSGFHTGSFSFAVWGSDLAKNLKHPIALLILQLLVILIVARTFGWAVSLFRQPMVIGEIIAGIVLGPSFLGWVLPEYSSFLFPKDSLKSIQALSQIGLFLFLFLVGMELDVKILGKKAHDAVVAVVGKFFGSSVAAKLVGQSWRFLVKFRISILRSFFWEDRKPSFLIRKSPVKFSPSSKVPKFRWGY